MEAQRRVFSRKEQLTLLGAAERSMRLRQKNIYCIL